MSDFSVVIIAENHMRHRFILQHQVYPEKLEHILFKAIDVLQASVTLLERLPIVLEKSSEHDLHHYILPLLFNALDSKMSQIQVRIAVFHSFRNHNISNIVTNKPNCCDLSLIDNPVSLSVQMAAVSIIPSVLDYFDDDVVRNQVFDK